MALAPNQRLQKLVGGVMLSHDDSILAGVPSGRLKSDFPRWLLIVRAPDGMLKMRVCGGD
jgi:hypothetical protein